MPITPAAWAAALTFTAIAVLRLVHMSRQAGAWKDAADWFNVALFSCMTIVTYTILGAIRPATGGVLAGVTAVIGAVLLMSVRKHAEVEAGPARIIGGHVGGGFRQLGADLGVFLRWLRHPAAPGGDGSSGAESIPLEAVAEAVATRVIPPIRDDAALGEAPLPEKVAETLEAASVAVPAPWAAVASYIASFEADTEAAELTFQAGNAAGMLAASQAMAAHGDHLLNGVGVDPAIVAAVVELSGVWAETSGTVALVIRRMKVVYQEIRDAIAAGLKIPHKARQWFGDGTAA